MWSIRRSFVVLIKYLLLANKTYSAYECGMRKVSVNNVIVNGQPTSPGAWPWHVAVFQQKTLCQQYACGGTLISVTFVLTADHCIRDENGHVISSRMISVRMGLHHLFEINPKAIQQHNVLKIHKYISSDERKNDIAILELKTEAEFTDYVQPACLNLEEDLTRQFGTAIGWGVDESDEISPILKSQRMPVVSTNQCLENNDGIFRHILDSSIFCAGYKNGTTVCNGDSGGGLHFERNGVWYVGGIVSFTAPRQNNEKCNLKSYAGFTNLYHFLSWIRNVTGLCQMNVNRESPAHLLPQDCGRYLVNRITGGTRANLYEFPWVVRLIYKSKTTGQLRRGCHGSLINKRYVLTSAFCATNEYYKPNKILLGYYDQCKELDCNVYNASDCAPPVQRVGIECIIAHPKFNKSSYWNDIALIRLARDIKFEDHIQPICLPLTQSLRQQTLEQGIVAGWGRLRRGEKYPDIQRKATVRVVAKFVCRKSIDEDHYIGDDVICTGGSNTSNTCEWDNGTPLGNPTLYNERVRFVQFGVMSTSGCGSAPSRYTFVPNYMDWILSNLSS